MTVDDLCRHGCVSSTKAQLLDFGFRRVRVAGRATAADLAEAAVRALFRQTHHEPNDVDVIFYATAVDSPRLPRATPRSRPSALFRYAAARLQDRLGMNRANVVGVGQAGCASFFSAIRLARGLLAAEPNVRLALCVGADTLPAGGHREILYNLISDGACAVLVERDARVNRVVAYVQTTKGFYWDSVERENEIVAAYFPTARAVMRQALDQAGLTIDDIGLIIPHNVNRSSWTILLRLLDAPTNKFFGRNIGARGHTIAADTIINLADAIRLGRVRPGDYVMLFTFGFGAHWACLILQH